MRRDGRLDGEQSARIGLDHDSSSAAAGGLVPHPKRRRVGRPGVAPVVEPGGADVGVAEPLLDAGDVGLVLKGIGRRGSAKAVYPEAGDCNAGRAGVGADYGIDAVSGEPGAGAPAAQRHEERRLLLPHMVTRGREIGVDALGGDRMQRQVSMVTSADGFCRRNDQSA